MKLTKEVTKKPSMIREGNEKDCQDTFCDAVEQGKKTKEEMKKVMASRSDVPHTGKTSDIDDALKKSGVTKETMKKDIVEKYLKEQYDFIKNGSKFNVNVKNRVELGKLVEFLKKNNVKHSISRSLKEGVRYNVEISGKVLCESNDYENIDIKEFVNKFEDNYNFLYDAEGEVAGEYEALDYFDNVFLPKTEDENSDEYKLLKAFNTAREDTITSDREAEAFAFTLEDFGLLTESIKKNSANKLTESSVIKDTKELQNGDTIELGCDKNDGWFVNKVCKVGDVCQRDMHKLFKTEDSARSFFDRISNKNDKLNDELSLNEDVADDYIGKKVVVKPRGECLECGTIVGITEGGIVEYKIDESGTTYLMHPDFVYPFTAKYAYAYGYIDGKVTPRFTNSEKEVSRAYSAFSDWSTDMFGQGGEKFFSAYDKDGNEVIKELSESCKKRGNSKLNNNKKLDERLISINDDEAEDDFYIVIEGRREGYGIDQVESNTLTVGELIDYLHNYDEDTKVVIGNDRQDYGYYTYGSITPSSINDVEIDRDVEESCSNKKVGHKEIEESKEPDNAEVLKKVGKYSIIKDGYGFGIDNGTTVNRFIVDNDGNAKYDSVPSESVKQEVNKLIKKGAFTNKNYKGDDAKYVGNTMKYGSGIEEAKEPMDADSARELALYIENDAQLYKSRIIPTIDNLARKMAKGNYDKELAIKAFKYVADEGAKKYTKEFADADYDKYTFNPATREETARALRDYFEDDINEKAEKFKGKRNESLKEDTQLGIKDGGMIKDNGFNSYYSDKQLVDLLVAQGTCYTKKEAETRVNRMSQEMKDDLYKSSLAQQKRNFMQDSLESDVENDVINESLKLITDISEFEPWSGAVSLWNEIVDADKVDELEFALEDIYPDGMTRTELNDILWFEENWVREMLGLGNVKDDEE